MILKVRLPKQNTEMGNEMKFKETHLSFEPLLLLAESNFEEGSKELERVGQAGIIGLRVRIGNRPIVTNLKKVLESVHTTLPPSIAFQFQDRELYSIVHAFGVTRKSGKGNVIELQYEAEMVEIGNKQLAQTVELIPHTRFKEVFKADTNISIGLSTNGIASAKIPERLNSHLLQDYICIGGDLDLQLSNSNSFIGKLSYSLNYPVVISTGIASNGCHWVLKPDEKNTPLLGDQLLVQIVSVPKHTEHIIYRIKGTVKVDQGLLYKLQSKETDILEIKVLL